MAKEPAIIWGKFGTTPAELMETARKYREKAYAPYSGFRVGAAALADDGTVFGGCNVENASYGLSICAERAVLCRAIAEGRKRFAAVAIAGPDGELCPPCGACRQFMVEFSPELIVILEGGGEIKEIPLRELIPHFFGPDDVSEARRG